MVTPEAHDDPENQVQSAIIRFATKILRPVVSVLLRNGFACNELEEVCRWLYVDETVKRRGLSSGVRPSESDIAVMSGLSHEAVLHYTHYASPEALVADAPGNRAARVQGGWLTDSRYREENGTPLSIPFSAPAGPSFTALVREYAGDVPARTVLSELERAGALEVQGELIHLTQVAYLPADEIALLEVSGMSAGDLLSTIHYNFDAKADNRYFQRELYYIFVPTERVGELRRLLNTRLEPVMTGLYEAIRKHGDPEPLPGRKYRRVGVGAYYFQSGEREVPD